MKEKKERKVHKKRLTKKLKISDIKRSEGAHVGHLLAKVKAKEVELTFCCVWFFQQFVNQMIIM